MVGFTGNPGQGNYTASKAGMVGMMKSVAAEYAQAQRHRQLHRARHYRQSPMTDKLNEKQREAILARVPWRKLGTPQRDRRGGGLSGLRRGRLRHRPDHSREWRHGDDLNARKCWICGACAGRLARASQRELKCGNRTSARLGRPMADVANETVRDRSRLDHRQPRRGRTAMAAIRSGRSPI